MKKILSDKFKISAALFLASLMAIGISIAGTGVTYALFSDRDSQKSAASKMAAVDIGMQQKFDEEYNRVNFQIVNNSDISIYLRAGVIVELLDSQGKPVIADMSEISVETTDTGWTVEKKTLSDNNGTYIKWFLKYGSKTDYTEVKPDENPAATFYIAKVPDGCKLVVNVVPEAVQVDAGNDALNDFKSYVNPTW